MKIKGPFTPREEHSTIRQAIRTLLEERPLSARDISVSVHIPEKEVVYHLEHIRVAIRRDGLRLVVTPAACAKCGFIFSKRERLTKPGRCPACRDGHVSGPLYRIGR